ncbi:DUF6929 family protein [Pedobacter rhizosphaerae]|uniref:Uncharacterized protein n=1 Tax=Pedobacter rhizosphaerae TaxID=390241 RepID=A0A1H9UC58_9SPHI|nr:hypothetical protein [Pedobacter rhizosphaerae]SES07140.1 hypothetical protein SAMN04488023_12951 [Pedobacter rhizosphaerae]
MYATHLEVFAEIEGIGAASGLFLAADLLYIIGDNSGYLNEYHTQTKGLNKIPILAGSHLTVLENIPKPEKPDFEILCPFGDELYALGSGSTPKRNLGIIYHLKSKKITPVNLSLLYNKFKSVAQITDENFNLEGAAFTGSNWLFFNRGNGSDAKNGIFLMKGKDLTVPGDIQFTPIKLPNINHVESSFTDVAIINEQIFFIATAEDTNSTYHDGEILASFIGNINLETLNLNFSTKIPGRHKFEGITLFSQTAEKIEFLLCEDRDNEELKTTIYRLSLVQKI